MPKLEDGTGEGILDGRFVVMLREFCKIDWILTKIGVSETLNWTIPFLICTSDNIVMLIDPAQGEYTTTNPEELIDRL